MLLLYRLGIIASLISVAIHQYYREFPQAIFALLWAIFFQLNIYSKVNKWED